MTVKIHEPILDLLVLFFQILDDLDKNNVGMAKLTLLLEGDNNGEKTRTTCGKLIILEPL